MSQKENAGRRESGLRLFTLFDIEIRLDYSVTIIFALIVYSLGAGVFPGWHPQWPAATNWTTAVVAGVLFFASLLAHELSHSLVARRYDIRVSRITLFLFGGVAEIESEAKTPGAEFTIAIAGPLMSLAIAVGCGLVSSSMLDDDVLQGILADPQKGMEMVSPLITICIWLGSVNFMLAIFNMVPGFPLDGGRVFRAIVWRITNDQMLATRYASLAGKWFGWTLMGLGLWNLLVLKSLGGMWLLLIGWFLSHLASASYAQAFTQHMLEPLKVKDLMRTRFDTVAAHMAVSNFVDDCLLRSNQLLWPVMQGKNCLGTVSLKQIMDLPPELRSQTRLEQILVPLAGSLTLSPEIDASQASHSLIQMGDQPVPVVSDDRIVGLLRGSDILKWAMVHQPSGSQPD